MYMEKNNICYRLISFLAQIVYDKCIFDKITTIKQDYNLKKIQLFIPKLTKRCPQIAILKKIKCVLGMLLS